MKFFNLEASQLADGTKTLEISIFGEIDPGFFADGVASKHIADQLTAHKDAKEITVRINSVGGDLYGGMSIYNLLRAHGGKVTAVVDGIAASAASIIAMAGRTVMNRGSMMMVHNPIGGIQGHADDLRQYADVLDKARDGLVAVYQAKTGMKPAALKKLLDAETWLTADEAKKHGFADEVADSPARAKAIAGGVIVNSIAFKRDVLPMSLQAMALPEDAPAEQAPVEPTEAPDPEKKPEPEQEEPAAAPAEVAAPEEPAATDPAAAERTRVSAILDLDLDDAELERRAIRDGWTKQETLEEAWKLERERKRERQRTEAKVGADRLSARERESAVVASVKHAPPQAAISEEKAAVEFMKAYAQRLNAAHIGRK